MPIASKISTSPYVSQFWGCNLPNIDLRISNSPCFTNSKRQIPYSTNNIVFLDIRKSQLT